MRRLHGIVMQWTSKTCTKSVIQMQNLCFAHKTTNCFLMLLLLPWLSLFLKLHSKTVKQPLWKPTCRLLLSLGKLILLVSIYAKSSVLSRTVVSWIRHWSPGLLYVFYLLDKINFSAFLSLSLDLSPFPLHTFSSLEKIIFMLQWQRGNAKETTVSS